MYVYIYIYIYIYNPFQGCDECREADIGTGYGNSALYLSLPLVMLSCIPRKLTYVLRVSSFIPLKSTYKKCCFTFFLHERDPIFST